MCLPAGIAGVIGAVASAASSAVGLFRQNSIAKKNQRAAEEFAVNQRRIRAQEAERQERHRGQAEDARQQSLNEVSPESLSEAQQSEAARLEQEFLPDQQGPQAVADLLFAGQERGGKVFQDAIQSRTESADESARKRVSALARLQSFGGSSGGVQSTILDSFQRGGNGIDLANNKRSGSLSAFGVEKSVNPVQYFG